MDAPAAYVRRMITNAFLDERRRWSTRHLRSVPVLPEVAGPDRTSSVDDRAELHLLLSRLPRQQRAAIVLRYYLDLADDEIGREIGCSAVAARSYISRGLTSLRITANQDSLDVRSASQPETGPQPNFEEATMNISDLRAEFQRQADDLPGPRGADGASRP